MTHDVQPDLYFLDHDQDRWQLFCPSFAMRLSAKSSERPLGSVYLGRDQDGPRTSFLVWAPHFAEVGLRVEAVTPAEETVYVSLRADPDEPVYFLGEGPVPAGSRYRYQTADGAPIGADPAALAYDKEREQSIVLDRRFVVELRARLQRVSGELPRTEQIHLIAQVHLGTSGGFAGLEQLCHHYRQLGFQGIQTLPETLFPGRFNAGYDLASLFAVEPSYGTPSELAQVNALAAELGLIRLADRVHNHIYPANLLERFGPYFAAEGNEWGRGPTCAAPHARAVRRYHREAEIRWFDDLGFSGARHDATFRVDDPLNRMLAADADTISSARNRPIFTIAEDNHNDRRVTRPRQRDERALGFHCQYAPDKRHSALALALLAQRQPITKHYLKPFVGLQQDEDAALLYANDGRWQRAFERAFRVHTRSLRQGMGIEHRKGQTDISLEPPADQPPSATLALVEYHDGPQNNEAGQFIAAEMGPARTVTHYLAHAAGPETKLVFRGAEEVIGSAERRFGWVADLDAVDKLNAAMGRHLGDLAGDHTLKPPWHPDFLHREDDEPCFLADPQAPDARLTWRNWRVSWVVERARDVAQRSGTAELLRPELLEPDAPVPQVDWQRYFAQVADSGLQLVDFASEAALEAYGFDPKQVSEAAEAGRRRFKETCATVAARLPRRDWHTLCVVAWDARATALLQRWDSDSGNRLLFVENLSTKRIEVTLTPDAALLDGQRGRIEPLDPAAAEKPEHDYRVVWELFTSSAEPAWGPADSDAATAIGAPERIDLSGQPAPSATLRLDAGHAVLYLSGLAPQR